MDKIDLTDPKNLSQKVMDEKKTRKRLLKHARLVGCEMDMKLLFEKYDKLLRNCTNDQERKDISKLGCWEMYSLLGRGGELYVNNQLVYSEKNEK